MSMYVILSKRGQMIPPVGQAELNMLKDININMEFIERKAREFLRSYTPVNTGYMLSHIKTWGTRLGSLGGFSFYLGWKESDFGDRPYPKWVNYGTGIFGGHKTPIVPREAKMLAWQTNGVWKRAHSVLGQKPQMMFEKTLNDWNQWILTYIERKRVVAWRRTL